MINPSIPVNMPQMAVEAPTESVPGLTTDEKRVPPNPQPKYKAQICLNPTILSNQLPKSN